MSRFLHECDVSARNFPGKIVIAAISKEARLSTKPAKILCRRNRFANVHDSESHQQLHNITSHNCSFQTQNPGTELMQFATRHNVVTSTRAEPGFMQWIRFSTNAPKRTTHFNARIDFDVRYLTFAHNWVSNRTNLRISWAEGFLHSRCQIIEATSMCTDLGGSWFPTWHIVVKSSTTWTFLGQKKTCAHSHHYSNSLLKMPTLWPPLSFLQPPFALGSVPQNRHALAKWPTFPRSQHFLTKWMQCAEMWSVLRHLGHALFDCLVCSLP